MLFTRAAAFTCSSPLFHVRKPLYIAVDFYTFHFFDNQSLCTAFSVFFLKFPKNIHIKAYTNPAKYVIIQYGVF